MKRIIVAASIRTENDLSIVKVNKRSENVNPGNFVQRHGRMNKHLTEQERQIVRLWAKAESLEVCLHGF